MSGTKQIVPLISTGVAGPSGIMHLPRLWLKILLHATGQLADGYRHGDGGFDEGLCTHFELDRDAFVAFVETEKPDYLTTERYVLEHAKNVTPETIAEFNTHVSTATFSDPARAKLFRDRVGLTDESVAAVLVLNNLDDWFAFHETLANG